ncbi:MAG: hypothetical protein K5639_06635, partial [Eubacterium sp.]|nr:hypothetical protein [Eubacterium sp.]
MRIKKTALVLICIVFVLVGWNSYRNEIELAVPNVCSYDVPTVSEKTGALWYRKFSDNYFMGTSMTSSPIVTEKNIYVVNRDILYELNMNGGIERKLTLDARMNSTCHPVLAYGKLYIPLMNARVECVDTSDFSVVFSVCTCDDEKNSFQSLCPVLYHNGYIYSGVWAAKSGGQIDTKAVSSGYCYCLDASDGRVVWKYGQDGSSSGFYWNSAVVCGDKLCFISEGGRVIVHGLTDEKIYDTYELTDGEQIRCGLCQDMTGGSIFTVSKKGILYKFSVDTSGKISKQKSVRLIESAKSISATSTPTVYAGKLYMGCFADGYGYLCVRSAADLSVICDAQGEKGSEIKCPPVVVDKTETGTEEDIYVYFTSNNPTGSLYMMHDGRISKFFEPQRDKQYCIA